MSTNEATTRPSDPGRQSLEGYPMQPGQMQQIDQLRQWGDDRLMQPGHHVLDKPTWKGSGLEEVHGHAEDNLNIPLPNGPEHLVHRLILVRHGRTHYNFVHRIQGWVDIPLDDHGLWQVTSSGYALRKLYVDSQEAHEQKLRQVVISSDLVRAEQTARAFADPAGIPVHEDIRLRERFFGDWEAHTQTELQKTDPEGFAGWMRGEGTELQHHAESRIHTGARGAAAINDWATRLDPSTDLFYFSHGSNIAMTVQYLLGLHEEDHFDVINGMRNAFWAVMYPAIRSNGTFRWRLDSYNCGPTVAQSFDWDGSMTRSKLS